MSVIENVEVYPGSMYGGPAKVTVVTSEGIIKFPRPQGVEHPVEKVAKRYLGKDACPILQRSLERIGKESVGESFSEIFPKRKPFLPMRVARPAKGETSTSGLFEMHWKNVPFDLAVFDDRWEISLREEKEYRSGHHSYSRIYITSVLEVRDRETGRSGIVRVKITPDDDGPNRFAWHLGNKVLAMRVVGDEIVVRTRFGCTTGVHIVNLCSPDS